MARPTIRRLHGGLYQNIKRGSPRFHQRFRLGPGGEHRYRSGVVIGRKPYDPLQPLQGRAFNQQLQQGVNYQFQPQEAQLGAERRISDQSQRNIDSWYGGYLSELENARKATQAGYAGAQKAAYGQANTAANQDVQAQQAQQAEAQRGAMLRGTMAGGNAEAQQAIASRQKSGSSLGDLIGTQGANTGAYMADKKRIGALSRTGQHLDEASRRRSIETAARGLAQQKGAYKSQLKGQMTGAERQYALERSTFGLQAAQASDRAAFQRGELKNVRRGQNLVARQHTLDRQSRDRLGRINAALRGQGLTETHRHNLQTERAAIMRINKPRAGGGRKAQIDYERAVGLIRSRTLSKDDHRTYADVLLRDPRRWGPRIERLLQGRYGHHVARRAVRRVLHTRPRHAKGLF